MLNVLHWLPFQHQIVFRIAALVWRCLLSLAPAYRDTSNQWNGGVLFVPFARTSTCQTHAFSVVGSSVWNGLPFALRLLPRVHSDVFYSSLKTALFSHAIESGVLLSSNLEEVLHKST